MFQTFHVSADMLYYGKMKQNPGCEIRAWAVQADLCAHWSWQRLRSSATDQDSSNIAGLVMLHTPLLSISNSSSCKNLESNRILNSLLGKKKKNTPALPEEGQAYDRVTPLDLGWWVVEYPPAKLKGFQQQYSETHRSNPWEHSKPED